MKQMKHEINKSGVFGNASINMSGTFRSDKENSPNVSQAQITPYGVIPPGNYNSLGGRKIPRVQSQNINNTK